MLMYVAILSLSVTLLFLEQNNLITSFILIMFFFSTPAFGNNNTPLLNFNASRVFHPKDTITMISLLWFHLYIKFQYFFYLSFLIFIEASRDRGMMRKIIVKINIYLSSLIELKIMKV